jgi:hypothetical protein
MYLIKKKKLIEKIFWFTLSEVLGHSHLAPSPLRQNIIWQGVQGGAKLHTLWQPGSREGKREREREREKERVQRQDVPFKGMPR